MAAARKKGGARTTARGPSYVAVEELEPGELPSAPTQFTRTPAYKALARIAEHGWRDKWVLIATFETEDGAGTKATKMRRRGTQGELPECVNGQWHFQATKDAGRSFLWVMYGDG